MSVELDEAPERETIMQMVEREAAAAEAEPETEPEGGPEPEPDPEPEPTPASDAEMAKRDKAMNSEDKRHENAVAKLYGPDWSLMTDCPLCLNHGYVPTQPDPDFDPMQRLAVLTSMGEGAPVELAFHPDFYRCELCDGWGELSTHSRRDVMNHEQCPDCGGRGSRSKAQDHALAGVQLPYTPPAVVLPPLGSAPTNGAPPTATITQGGHTFTGLPGAAPDQLGRMAGHPLWGFPAESGGI